MKIFHKKIKKPPEINERVKKVIEQSKASRELADELVKMLKGTLNGEEFFCTLKKSQGGNND